MKSVSSTLTPTTAQTIRRVAQMAEAIAITGDSNQTQSEVITLS